MHQKVVDMFFLPSSSSPSNMRGWDRSPETCPQQTLSTQDVHCRWKGSSVKNHERFSPDMHRSKVLKRVGSQYGGNGAVLGMAWVGSLLHLNCHCAPYFQGLQVEGFAQEDPVLETEIRLNKSSTHLVHSSLSWLVSRRWRRERRD